jgi:hypothetical protein
LNEHDWKEISTDDRLFSARSNHRKITGVYIAGEDRRLEMIVQDSRMAFMIDWVGIYAVIWALARDVWRTSD